MKKNKSMSKPMGISLSVLANKLYETQISPDRERIVSFADAKLLTEFNKLYKEAGPGNKGEMLHVRLDAGGRKYIPDAMSFVTKDWKTHKLTCIPNVAIAKRGNTGFVNGFADASKGAVCLAHPITISFRDAQMCIDSIICYCFRFASTCKDKSKRPFLMDPKRPAEYHARIVVGASPMMEDAAFMYNISIDGRAKGVDKSEGAAAYLRAVLREARRLNFPNGLINAHERQDIARLSVEIMNGWIEQTISEGAAVDVD